MFSRACLPQAGRQHIGFASDSHYVCNWAKINTGKLFNAEIFKTSKLEICAYDKGFFSIFTMHNPEALSK